ncbi:MAG: LysM domain-containing protein, partial [Polyangia bacterium]|nr:LysM domain-containing protein [Polyangia bacterium]
MTRFILPLALVFLLGQPALSQPRSGQRQYVVQPGDSCWRIAERVFGDGRKYGLIHRLNDLGPLPHLLKPGQVLWLPGSGEGPLAQVSWLRRDVKAR